MGISSSEDGGDDRADESSESLIATVKVWLVLVECGVGNLEARITFGW